MGHAEKTETTRFFFQSRACLPPLAHAFFERHLPASIQKHMDLSGLKLERGSFVDARLRRKVTDMLFSVPFAGARGYLYLLVEHQSQPDPMMSFRIRQYQGAIMEMHLKQHGGTNLPLIYPVVFYTGQQAYTAPRRMVDLFEGPREWVEQCLNGPHQVIDLSRIPDEELKGHHLLWAYLGLLKHIHDADLTALLLDMIPTFLHIEKENQGADFVVQVLRYAVDSGEAKNFDVVLETLAEVVSEPTKGEIMTIADTLIEKGKEIGKEIGVQEGIQKTALNLLKAGADEAFVVQITELSLEEVQALRRRLES